MQLPLGIGRDIEGRKNALQPPRRAAATPDLSPPHLYPNERLTNPAQSVGGLAHPR